MNVRPLTPAEERWRDLLLEYAETMLPTSTASMDELQRLYEHFSAQVELGEGVADAIGLAFAASLVRGTDFEWVWTEDDEYPPEIAVGIPGLKLICHPLSMIAKRLTRGEPCDLRALRRDTVSQLQILIADEVAGRGH
jgi:hypothetical protein